MRFVRRAAFAVGLGLHRVRAGRAGTLLVLAGVAAAGSLLGGVLVGSLVARERAMERAVETLPPSVRSIRVSWFGIPGQGDEYDAVDRDAGRVVGGATKIVLFRESTIAGRFAALGAVDGLSRWVRLTSGRLPRTCDADRCEVVQLRGAGPLPHGFVAVGRARLRSTTLFGDAVPADRNALDRARLAPAYQRSARYHAPAPPPLLLGDDVRTLAAHPALRSTYRSYGWVEELRPEDVQPWEVGAFLRRLDRARASLQARSSEFELVAPFEELADAQQRTAVASRRLALLGGQAVALLLAFAGFAASRLRRPAQAADRRLVLLGVSGWQRVLATASQAAAVAVVGVGLAWVAALAVAAAFGGADVARNALLTLDAAAAAVALVVVVALVVGLVLGARVRAGARMLDAVAVALLALVATALARGAADVHELLTSRSTAVVLLALPIAIVAVAGIAAARVVAPLARFVARRLPREALGARLAALSVARRPGAAAVAAAFVAVSVGLALFAETYRATLDRGQSDQAAFALGADFVLREDLSRLIPVREIASEARLRALGDGVSSAPVLRAGANVPGLTAATGVTVLGLEPTSLTALRGAELRVPTLAVPSELRGPALSGETLAFAATSSVPGVSLEAAVRGPGGAFARIPLGEADGRVSARLPAPVRGGTLLGLRLVPPPRLQERGADAGRSVSGVLRLGIDFDGWIGVGGATARGRTVAFTLSQIVDTWFRPRQALDGRALPAVVSPALASLADDERRLPLQVAGRSIVLRVVEVAPRFPSARGDFAVLDRKTLENALNLVEPGSAFPTEAWIDVDAGAAERVRRALARGPFDALDVDSRAAREEELRSDPLARGSLAMLAVGAGAALVLALLAVTLGTLADVRDDRAELFDLETQGAAPSFLRRLVRLRQVAPLVVGVLGGALVGAALAALVVDVVAVSAVGRPPVPPLARAFDGALVALGLTALAAAFVALVWLATRTAFRDREAGRPQEVA